MLKPPAGHPWNSLLGSNPILVPILHAPTESFGSEVDGADAVVDTAERGGEGLWAGSQLGSSLDSRRQMVQE